MVEKQVQYSHNDDKMGGGGTVWGVTFVRDKMGRLHAKSRFTMSWRPQRAAMCKGLSSMDCSVTAATLAPSSTSGR